MRTLIHPCAFIFAFVLATVSAYAGAEDPVFLAARPIWPQGRATERNLLVEFRADFLRPEKGPVQLRLTGASLYRCFVNGRFAGHGPAKAGHGFFRVDEWDLTTRLQPGRNTVFIEVAGYNVNSFYLLDQPSFLQAEVVAGVRVLAATGAAGDGGFQAWLRHDRVQKVQRYSFQRPFSEVWRRPGPSPQPVECETLAPVSLAPRRVPYPTFVERRPVAAVAEGAVQKGPLPQKVKKDRSLTAIGPLLGGFREEELATTPSIDLQAIMTVSRRPVVDAPLPCALRTGSYRTLDLGLNNSGFIGLRVTARTRTRLFVTFDEVLTPEGDVDFLRLDCVNIVAYELAPGEHLVESFEPYTLRYLKLMVIEGDCEVRDCYLRELVNPHADRGQFVSSDIRYNRLFAAARETFRQNAPDIFMDCPSRERAGWLCDSFFTARVGLDLCGETTVEKNFLENFQRPAAFPHLPDGMLPMCYPSDHNKGRFIPNWAMWFVLQLEEYLARSRDRDLVEALRSRVLRLVEFFRPLENTDGLLEQLPSWVFVEWSKANSFVQDVNYPSNMLYAGMLDAVSRLYARPDLAAKAGRIRDTIRRQSFDGTFFVDNAVRQDGKLVVTTNRTEVCQYFAFFFDVATPQTHARLWQSLATDFGPQRKQTKAFSDVHPANAFIGNMLRFELLSRYGRNRQILDEALGYWLYMAERTGTLWEHDAPQASCNHGFASHAAHVLLRDVLGLRRIDPNARRVEVHFADLNLTACRGSIPTPDGSVELDWRKEDGRLIYRLKVPVGFHADIDNRSGCTLVQEP